MASIGYAPYEGQETGYYLLIRRENQPILRVYGMTLEGFQRRIQYEKNRTDTVEAELELRLHRDKTLVSATGGRWNSVRQ